MDEAIRLITKNKEESDRLRLMLASAPLEHRENILKNFAEKARKAIDLENIKSFEKSYKTIQPLVKDLENIKEEAKKLEKIFLDLEKFRPTSISFEDFDKSLKSLFEEEAHIKKQKEFFNSIFKEYNFKEDQLELLTYSPTPLNKQYIETYFSLINNIEKRKNAILNYHKANNLPENSNIFAPNFPLLEARQIAVRKITDALLTQTKSSTISFQLLTQLVPVIKENPDFVLERINRHLKELVGENITREYLTNPKIQPTNPIHFSELIMALNYSLDYLLSVDQLLLENTASFSYVIHENIEHLIGPFHKTFQRVEDLVTRAPVINFDFFEYYEGLLSLTNLLQRKKCHNSNFLSMKLIVRHSGKIQKQLLNFIKLLCDKIKKSSQSEMSDRSAMENLKHFLKLKKFNEIQKDKVFMKTVVDCLTESVAAMSVRSNYTQAQEILDSIKSMLSN